MPAALLSEALQAALLLLLLAWPAPAQCNVAVEAPREEPAQARSFSIDYEQDAFLKDGRPFQMISGSLHYFRVPRVYWRDRMRKMRQAGLNTVATYVEWSSHEPTPGQYVMTGELNLLHFLQLAEEERLLVNLRVGPYICGERDMGGLPPWLLSIKPDIRLRTRDPVYTRYAKRWLDVLMPLIRPKLYGNGGPVILVQVENEYGSYSACDRQYLLWLRDEFRRHVGEEAVLYTTDGAGDGYLKCGKIPGVYATVDFGSGSDVADAFKPQRKVEPRGPLVNSEYYTGWLTHWAEREQTADTDGVVRGLRAILAANASLNFYVFMGGTNFGFMAGANYGDDYNPQLTSYDYDAPLTEAGDPTPKYYAIRQAIAQHTGRALEPGPSPGAAPKLSHGPLLLQRVADIQALAAAPTKSASYPRDFMQMHQSHGYVLYETRVPSSFVRSKNKTVLLASGLRDRGIVFLDQIRQGVLCRTKPRRTGLVLSGVSPGQRVSVLVENQGRINYGNRINDTKGLGNVTLDGVALRGWTMTQLPLDNMTRLDALVRRAARRRHGRLSLNASSVPRDPKRDIPGVYATTFVLPPSVTTTAGRALDAYQDSVDGPPLPDTFVDTTNWGKGVAFINGFNLGRYWPSVGPQVTLYLPGYLLRAPPAPNHLVLVETDLAPAIPELSLVAQPVLDGSVCGPSTNVSCC